MPFCSGDLFACRGLRKMRRCQYLGRPSKSPGRSLRTRGARIVTSDEKLPLWRLRTTQVGLVEAKKYLPMRSTSRTTYLPRFLVWCFGCGAWCVIVHDVFLIFRNSGIVMYSLVLYGDTMFISCQTKGEVQIWAKKMHKRAFLNNNSCKEKSGFQNLVFLHDFCDVMTRRIQETGSRWYV